MKPFTLTELFLEQNYNTKTGLFQCEECGAAVIALAVHVQWHNKVADL